jgi:hypothetical protein
MLRLSFAVLLGAALFAGVAAKSDAAARLRGNKVSISGCTSVAPPVCTLIMIKSGKQVYMLVEARPPITGGIGVTLVGEKAGDVSICFHPVVKVLKWKRNRMHCPK